MTVLMMMVMPLMVIVLVGVFVSTTVSLCVMLVVLMLSIVATVLAMLMTVFMSMCVLVTVVVILRPGSRSYFSAVVNYHPLSGFVVRAAGRRIFNFTDYRHAFNDAAKHNMFAVKVGSGLTGNEKL
jgi:hypothetical protein